MSIFPILSVPSDLYLVASISTVCLCIATVVVLLYQASKIQKSVITKSCRLLSFQLQAFHAQFFYCPLLVISIIFGMYISLYVQAAVTGYMAYFWPRLQPAFSLVSSLYEAFLFSVMLEIVFSLGTHVFMSII